MTVFTPISGVRAIHAINPVAKLGASLALAIPLILTIDWVSATVALLLEALLLPFAGITWRQFWLRTLPVWIAAPFTGLTILLYGTPSGQTYVEWGFIEISDGSIELAIAAILRILAIGAAIAMAAAAVSIASGAWNFIVGP